MLKMLHDKKMKDTRTTIFEGIDAQRTAMIEAMTRQLELAIGLVTRLRGPNGCPWDREQNPLSLRQYLIEEAYETLEVIDRYKPNADSKKIAAETAKSEWVKVDGTFEKGDQVKLREELGDLLLQIILHAQLAWERGDFHLGDVGEFMAKKLVSRHPHVFGDQVAENSDAVLANWEVLKKKEGRKSATEGLPKHLPSLQRAARLGDKVSRLGFDWKDWTGAWAKVKEEVSELELAMQGKVNSEIEHEIGDLFFSLCNLARHLKIAPEDAHRKAIGRFEDRFMKVEKLCEERGIQMEKATLEELDRLWDEVKMSEG